MDLRRPTLRGLLSASVRSPYLWSNLVYLLYTIGISYIDYGSTDVDVINRLYVVFNFIHFANAGMYIWVWRSIGYEIYDYRVMFPEWLNLIEASLYIASSFMYPYTNTDTLDDSWTHAIHILETVACCVELVAAFGWLYTWQKTYPRVRGHGLTLDDPELWAGVSVIIAAVVYVIYNVQILMGEPMDYATNILFKRADDIYLINSVFYVLATLREIGWFFWLPESGVWSDSEAQLDRPLIASGQRHIGRDRTNFKELRENDGDDVCGILN